MKLLEMMIIFIFLFIAPAWVYPMGLEVVECKFFLYFT